MFVDAVMSVSDRFLREQTFELIVAPAIADLQYDAPTADALRHTRNCAAVLTALGWGLYEEITSNSTPFTFLLLVAIPAFYYYALLMVCASDYTTLFDTFGERVALGSVVTVLSLGPAIVCYWPEPRSRRESAEQP